MDQRINKCGCLLEFKMVEHILGVGSHVVAGFGAMTIRNEESGIIKSRIKLWQYPHWPAMQMINHFHYSLWFRVAPVDDIERASQIDEML